MARTARGAERQPGETHDEWVARVKREDARRYGNPYGIHQAAKAVDDDTESEDE